MDGFITKKEIEENKDFIIETYGLDFYEACMEAEGTTFLDLLRQHFIL